MASSADAHYGSLHVDFAAFVDLFRRVGGARAVYWQAIADSFEADDPEDDGYAESEANDSFMVLAGCIPLSMQGEEKKISPPWYAKGMRHTPANAEEAMKHILSLDTLTRHAVLSVQEWIKYWKAWDGREDEHEPRRTKLSQEDEARLSFLEWLVSDIKNFALRASLFKAGKV